jgi:hypothetical protein
MLSIRRFYHLNTIYSNKFIQIRNILFDVSYAKRDKYFCVKSHNPIVNKLN